MAVYLNPWDIIAKGVLGAGASGLAAYGFAEGDLSAVTWTELGVGIRSAASVAFKTGGIDKLLGDMLVDEHGPLVGGVKEQVDSVIKKLSGAAAGEPADVVSAANNAIGGLAERGQALLPDQPPSFPLMNQEKSIRLQKIIDDVAPHYPARDNPIEDLIYRNYKGTERIPVEQILDEHTLQAANHLDAPQMNGTVVLNDARGTTVTHTIQNGREIQCEIYREQRVAEIDTRSPARKVWDRDFASLVGPTEGLGTELITERFDEAGRLRSRVVQYQGPAAYRNFTLEYRDKITRAPNGDVTESRRLYKHEELGKRPVTYDAVKNQTGLTSLKVNGEEKLAGKALLFAEPTGEVRMQHLRDRTLQADRRLAEEAGRVARAATQDGAAAAAARTGTANLRRLKDVDPEHFQHGARANLVVISLIEAILITYLTGCGFGSADQGKALDYSKDSFSQAHDELLDALADPLQWDGEAAEAYNEEVQYQLERARKAGVDGPISDYDRHVSYATTLQSELCAEALQVRTLRWIMEGLLTAVPLLEWIAYKIRNTLGVPSCVAFQLACFTSIVPTATSYVARAGQDAGDRAESIDKVAYDFNRLAKEFSG